MSEAISVECPECGAKLKLKNRSSVGKRVPCPKCKKPFVVKVPDADGDLEFMNVSEPDDEFAVPPDDDVAAQMSGRPPVRSGRSKSKPTGSKKQRPGSGSGLKTLLVAGSVLAVLGLIGGVGYFVAPLIGDLLSRNKIDLAWLPPDAELIVHARVAETWNSPFVKALTNGPGMPPGLGELKGLVGLDAADIRSVTMGATGVFNQIGGGGLGPMPGMNPAAGAVPPMSGATPKAIVVVRTTQPFEAKPMQQKLGATRTEQYQQQELIHLGGAGLAGPVCFLPDASTIVMGAEAEVKAAIDRGAKAARRVDIDFIDPSRQVLIVAVPKDPSAFDSRGTPSPIPIEALSKIEAALKGKMKGFCLGLTFTENLDWSVLANCTSSQAAADVSATLDSSLKDVKTQFDQFRSNAPPQFSELVVIGGDILGSIKLQTQGEMMQANGRIPGSVKSAVEKLPQLMLAGALGGLPGGGGGGFDAQAFSGPEKSTVDPTAPGQVNFNPLLTAEQAARLARCKNNLKQLGLAMHNYHDVNQQLPGSAIRDSSGKPLLSWRVALLPYLDQGDLYKAFHLDEPWDSTHNMTLIPQMPALFAFPEGKAAPGATSYLAVAGPGAIFESGAPRKIADVTDGTSNTILIVEADDSLAVTWTRPDDYVYVPEKPMQGLVGRHTGGFLALTCDGAAHFVGETLDPLILVSLYTRAGGEQIPPGILR